jgi:hypothetical protein
MLKGTLAFSANEDESWSGLPDSERLALYLVVSCHAVSIHGRRRRWHSFKNLLYTKLYFAVQVIHSSEGFYHLQFQELKNLTTDKPPFDNRDSDRYIVDVYLYSITESKYT